MASNTYKPHYQNHRAPKKSIPLPEPKDEGLIKFMIKYLAKEKAKNEPVRGVFVDATTNKVNISGSKIEVAERETLVRNLIEEYKNGKTEKVPMSTDLNKRKVKIPDDLMGYVIGRGGHNLQNARHETGARIDIVNGEFCISGTDKQCKKAVKKLKSDACNSVYQTLKKKQFSCHVYDYVDGTGPCCYYKLNPTPPKTYWYHGTSHFKIDRIDEDESDEIDGEIQMDDLNNVMRKVLDKIQKPDLKDSSDGSGNDEYVIPKSDFWLHFGHIFITGNVDEDEQEKEFSLEEFQTNLNKKSWKMVFDSAIREMEVTALEEALAGNEHADIPSHTRYDITFITPSCKRIRVKIFLDSDGKPTKDFIDQFVDIQPDHQLQHSSVPYLVCDTFHHRAKINIAIPSRSMDVRMNMRTIGSRLTRSHQELDEELDEERILKTYLDRITIDDGKVILPDDLPHGFCLLYFRRCDRHSYCYDYGEESFTIVISEEQEIDPDNDGEQFEKKTDIHINSDGINQLLRSGVWEPDDIIVKLPTFLSVVRDIQANISTSED